MPALARGQLRVRPQLGHAVHAGVGDLRLFQPLDDLRGRELAEGCQDDGFERGAAFIAACIAVKARVRCQRPVLQHHFAKQLPLTLVLQAQHHGAAVARLKRTIGVDAGVRGGRARRWRGAFVGVVQRVAHPFGQ